MLYVFLKYIHIVNATILFGTGLGSVFYFWRAHCSADLPSMYFAARNVVLADWIFTTPAIIIQPLTGLWMVHLAGWVLTSKWILYSLFLYLLAGACWLPVVWLQIQMRNLIKQSLDAGEVALNARYYRYFYS